MKKILIPILLLAGSSFAASLNCQMKQMMPDYYKAQLHGPYLTAGQTTYTLNVISMFYGYVQPYSFQVKADAKGFKGSGAVVEVTKKEGNKISEIKVTTTKKLRLSELEMNCE